MIVLSDKDVWEEETMPSTSRGPFALAVTKQARVEIRKVSCRLLRRVELPEDERKEQPEEGK